MTIYFKNRIVLVISLCLYAVLISFGLYHHEPWRDEAHAWAHAREASITELIDDIKYEGTPVLWYIILAPFAKSGFPYDTMKVVHGSAAIAAVGLLLFFGELPVFLKILFIFSYFMAFEYAVISRNYVLTVLLLFSIATIYKKRFTKPVLYGIFVGLLFQINLHSIGWAMALMVVYVFELIKCKLITLKHTIGIAIMLSLGGFTYATLLSGPASRSVPPITPYTMEIYKNILHSSIVPNFPQFTYPASQSIPIDLFIDILTYTLFISVFVFLSKNKTMMSLGIMMIGWIFIVNVIIYPGLLRHRGLLLIVLIFILWVANRTIVYSDVYRNIAKGICVISLGCLLIFSWGYTIYIYSHEYRYNFSGARDMAMYIKNHGLESKNIVTFGSSYTEAVEAYFPNKKFWYAEFGGFGYYNVADLRYHDLAIKKKMTLLQAVALAKEAFPGNTDFLLLLPMALTYPEVGEFVYLYSSEAQFFWENNTEFFWVYSRK